MAHLDCSLWRGRGVTLSARFTSRFLARISCDVLACMYASYTYHTVNAARFSFPPFPLSRVKSSGSSSEGWCGPFLCGVAVGCRCVEGSWRDVTTLAPQGAPTGCDGSPWGSTGQTVDVPLPRSVSFSQACFLSLVHALVLFHIVNAVFFPFWSPRLRPLL